MFENPNLVLLSQAPAVVFTRLGIRLTKSQIMEIGKETYMILSVGKDKAKHDYVAIEPFLNHLSKVYHAPEIDTAKDNNRKDKAKRYSEITKEIMRRLFTLLFAKADYQGNKMLLDAKTFKTFQKDLRGQFLHLLRTNSTITNAQKENTLFGNRDLLFHLVSFCENRDSALESLGSKLSSYIRIIHKADFERDPDTDPDPEPKPEV